MLSIAERHKYILDKLNKYGFVRITDVANELGVTKVTIRKDVKILESKGLLYKVHGSARPANPHVADLDVHVKDNINRDAKRLIAQRAVELLDDNDSIIIASGCRVRISELSFFRKATASRFSRPPCSFLAHWPSSRP